VIQTAKRDIKSKSIIMIPTYYISRMVTLLISEKVDRQKLTHRERNLDEEIKM